MRQILQIILTGSKTTPNFGTYSPLSQSFPMIINTIVLRLSYYIIHGVSSYSPQQVNIWGAELGLVSHLCFLRLPSFQGSKGVLI